MSSLMQQSGLDGATLASLGLEMKLDSSFKNPTLSLDDSKLDAALNDLPKLERVLTGDGVTDGLITRIRDFAFAANGVNGDITTRTKGLEALKKSNESAVEAMELRLTQREQNLLKQYQALDAKMAGTSSLSSFLSAQIGQWNK
jgi:flagellar hook-associated protein 2